jgi:hypothetical protein
MASDTGMREFVAITVKRARAVENARRALFEHVAAVADTMTAALALSPITDFERREAAFRAVQETCAGLAAAGTPVVEFEDFKEG